MIGTAALMSFAAMAAKTKSPDVIGHVYDENGEPMPYANVVLLALPDSTFVNGSTSGEDGVFNIATDLTKGVLKISSIGYETIYIPLATFREQDKVMIQMKEDSQILGEVTIKSSLPKTRVKGDAMNTLVAGSILEKAGSATDLLNKIPSLSANKDGGVEVFGRGSAEIYINGRKVQDTKELSRLRAEQIQSIDVVQNPGARYAATTKAVVRIQLKKAQGEGISFMENGYASYEYKLSATNNLDVNYRKGGLDLTASFWSGMYGNRSLQTNDLTYHVGQDKYVGQSAQDMSGYWRGISPQLQINYMVNENHSFGAFYKWDRNYSNDYGGWLNTDSYKNSDMIERSESLCEQNTSFKKHIFNAYYNGKVGNLSIDFNLDGLFSDDDQPNSTTETITDYRTGDVAKHHVDNNTVSGNNFIASKLIFGYPLWKGNFSVGAEYSHNNRTDVYTFDSKDELAVTATDNKIKESSASAFAEYGRVFGKLYAQVGLRYEHLNNDYYNFGKKEEEVCRSYGDLFPSVVLSMPIKDVQLSLSYRKDIARPSYQNLSNRVVYINSYTYQSGNPYLTPTYTHSVVFNAAYKWANLSINYSNVDGETSMFTEPYPGSDDPLLSLIRPKNSEKNYNRLIINPSVRPTIGHWHPMWSVGVVFQDYEAMCAKGTAITLNHPLVQAVWNNDWELSNNWRINAFAQYVSKGDQGNYRITKASVATRIGVQKDFNLKALGTLTCEARCMDMFQANRSECIIYSVRELTAINPSKVSFDLSVTWKFNEARSKYKGSGAGESQKSRM